MMQQDKELYGWKIEEQQKEIEELKRKSGNNLDKSAKDAISLGIAIIIGIALIIISLWGINAGIKIYGVWSQSKEGQAELAKADWNRQIAVREAKAKEESAVLLAQAEVERAKGVAQANKIIGDSLRQNEDYLRYLWINNLHEGNNQVIYIPTEANLPILEANRFNNQREGK
jgi:hypothetical protein